MQEKIMLQSDVVRVLIFLTNFDKDYFDDETTKGLNLYRYDNWDTPTEATAPPPKKKCPVFHCCY